jgi:hypothetical protein
LSDLTGRTLSEVFPELIWQELIARLEKEHQAVKNGSGREALVFYPVFNSVGNLSDVVCVRGREGLLSELARLGEETSRTVSRVRSLFRRQAAPNASPGADRGVTGEKRRSS